MYTSENGSSQARKITLQITHSDWSNLVTHIACENIRFSWLFAARNVFSGEEREKRMFSQARPTPLLKQRRFFPSCLNLPLLVHVTFYFDSQFTVLNCPLSATKTFN